jgi:hypothetical protein
VAVILAQVSLEHLDDDVQVGFYAFDVLTEIAHASVRLLDLLVCTFLRNREPPDDPHQADETVCDAVGLCRQLLEICRELSLLLQQKLHRPFDLLGRHRLKLHGIPSASALTRHYAIVVRRLMSKAPAKGASHLTGVWRFRFSKTLETT